MVKKPNGRIFFALFTIALITQFFTNCGPGLLTGFQSEDFSSFDLASMAEMPLDHPKETLIGSTEKKNLVSREYTTNLLREIFTSPGFDEGYREYLLRTWVLTKPGAMGGSCNPYSSYTTYDCGGGISNTSLPSHAEASAIRSSFRIKICEDFLSHDAGVNAVLEKINKTANAPNASAIQQIYALFRRGWDAPAGVVATLVELDSSLAQKNATVMDRWRIVIQMICEDPSWEGL